MITGYINLLRAPRTSPDLALICFTDWRKRAAQVDAPTGRSHCGSCDQPSRVGHHNIIISGSHSPGRHASSGERCVIDVSDWLVVILA